MIYKSYLIEKNINSLKENLVLFYGINFGIKKDFKEKIKDTNKNCDFLFFDQKNIIENSKILYSELFNISLFEKNKIFFIENVNEKILEIIQDIQPSLENQRIYLFADVLEKKSKIRSFFEKSKECAVIACYPYEITIKNIILERLKGYEGLSSINVNLILNHVSLDRIKLNNEIDKIVLDKELNQRIIHLT